MGSSCSKRSLSAVHPESLLLPRAEQDEQDNTLQVSAAVQQRLAQQQQQQQQQQPAALPGALDEAALAEVDDDALSISSYGCCCLDPLLGKPLFHSHYHHHHSHSPPPPPRPPRPPPPPKHRSELDGMHRILTALEKSVSQLRQLQTQVKSQLDDVLGPRVEARLKQMETQVQQREALVDKQLETLMRQGLQTWSEEVGAQFQHQMGLQLQEQMGTEFQKRLGLWIDQELDQGLPEALLKHVEGAMKARMEEVAATIEKERQSRLQEELKEAVRMLAALREATGTRQELLKSTATVKDCYNGLQSPAPAGGDACRMSAPELSALPACSGCVRDFIATVDASLAVPSKSAE